MKMKKNNQTNARRRKGAAKRNNYVGPRGPQSGYNRPPVLTPTISGTKTLRWYNGGTAGLTTVTAAIMLNSLVATVSTITSASRVFNSFRIKRVDIYFAQTGASTVGFVPSPTLEWENGSGALTEEGKSESRSSVISVRDVGGHIALFPPGRSNLGFWFNDTASGDIFSVNVPTGISTILDVTFEYTMPDGANVGALVILGGAAPLTGIMQASMTNWIPVGFSQAP